MHGAFLYFAPLSLLPPTPSFFLAYLGVRPGLGVVLAAEQEDGAVGPGKHPFAQRQQPLLGLGAPVRFLHASAELHVVVEAELLRKTVQVVEVLLVGPAGGHEMRT